MMTEAQPTMNNPATGAAAAAATNEATSSYPKITLHWLEVSRSHRILWLLEELAIPYELKTWKRGSDKLADPALKTVHPLGKSPILEITPNTPGAKPLILIESAAIVEYIVDYYGKWLVPERFAQGQPQEVGRETEEWIRYRTFMHYAEGSIMPLQLINVITNGLREAPVPFFLKPVTSTVAGKIHQAFLDKSLGEHYSFLEDQLKTSPGGGQYFCGKSITAADVMMSFPLEGGESLGSLKKAKYPKLTAYLQLLHERDAFKRAVKKIEAIEGTFKTGL